MRDLDDPLTMVHLFATLPAEKLHGIPPKIVHTSRRLALEWQVSHLEVSHLGGLQTQSGMSVASSSIGVQRDDLA